MLVSKVIFCVVLNFIICMLILLQYIKWRNWITFTQFHCHSPHHDPSPKDVMSAMSPRHQKWYIQKDLCLIHSEFPSIDRPLSYDPSNAQLQRDLLMTPMGSYAQESRARCKMVLLGVSFKFPARYPAIHHTFRASGLERLVPANIWCLDILGALCWHNY